MKKTLPSSLFPLSSFLLLTLSLSGCRQPADPFPTEEVHQLCRQYFPDDLPGAEVLILQGDSVVFSQGYGGLGLRYGDTGEPAVIDSATLFNIASCSKQFTAVAVLQLAQQGKIDIKAPIHRYFPEYSAPIWDSIAVWHLLAHCSGIPDARGYLSREEKIHGNEALAIEYLSTLSSLHFTPGTCYEYINPTYVLLGQLIERVSGMPFVDYVEQYILLPAGMHQTAYFNPADSLFARHWVHAYEYTDTSDMPEERPASNPNTNPNPNLPWFEYDYGEETFFATRPDGGLYTSAAELVRWERWLRSQQDLLQEAWEPHTLVSGSCWSDYQNRPGTWYGYGWFIEPEKHCIYHTGDNGGFKALVARYPEQEVLVVVLANRADWDRYALKTQLESILGL